MTRILTCVWKGDTFQSEKLLGGPIALSWIDFTFLVKSRLVVTFQSGLTLSHLCLSHSYFSVEPEPCITSLCWLCAVVCTCDSAKLLFSYFWLVGQRCVDIMYLCTPHPLCQTSTNLLHPHWCPLCLPNISCKVHRAYFRS